MNLDVTFVPGVPMRRQLHEAIRSAIRSGVLQPGVALPPSRALADDLGVSRGVVVDTYALLTTEGYLSARQGSATRVAYAPMAAVAGAARRPRTPSAFRYDLRPGQADLHAFPRARWQAALLGVLRELPDIRLTYQSHRGAPELRTAMAEHIGRTRRVVAEPDEVIICSGVSHGLSLLWSVMRARGVRRVAIEDPSWRWQRLTVEHAGLEAVPIRVDKQGIVVSDLDAADVDAVVVTAAHQYPTGAVLSTARRRELVAWAQRRGAVVVEDDYDAEYRYDSEPVLSLQRLAPDHVAFVGTTSKTMFPGMRLAWLVAPNRLADALENEMRVTGASPPTIEQLALARFVEGSELERHLRTMRKRYAGKREVLAESFARHLPGVRLAGAAAGLHALVWLPDGVDEFAAAERARAAGVAVHELHRHCDVTAAAQPAFVVGYALPSPSEIRAAVALLGEAVRG